METYDVWRNNHSGPGWIKTAHSVEGRSQKEAQSKVKRKFENGGFSSMSLLAVKRGEDPNVNPSGA